MNATYKDLMGAHQVDVPAHLQADAEIPIIWGLQRQGDVIVIPMRAARVSGQEPVPAEGVAVVRGEAGGNTHLWSAARPRWSCCGRRVRRPPRLLIWAR